MPAQRPLASTQITRLRRRLPGTDILHVPFAGFGPMLPAMYSGQVPMNLITLQTVCALIDSGKVKLLAIMNSNDKARHLFPK